jgi:diguanylate cyclase (GGDEF)-like protein
MARNYTLLKDNLADEKIFMARLMTALSVALFIAGIGLDYISAKSTFEEILYIRAVLCVALISTYITTLFREFFLKNYSYIAGGIYGVAAFSIIMMIYHTSSDELAYTTYFAGLMLVIITIFLGTYIDTITSIAISSIMIITFVVMSVFFKGVHDYSVMLNNIFFLSSSVIIGVISNSMRNKFLADRLFLQERLKTALRDEKMVSEEKTYLANMDGLTGLPNRRYSREKLKVMLEDAKRPDMALVVIYMDLNNFKQINDAFGHNIGDEVLKIASERLRFMMRKSDLISRQGGDEFLLALMIQKNDMNYAEEIIQKIPEVISKPMQSNKLRFAVGASVGSAVYPTNGDSVSALIDIADHKMYNNKRKIREDKNSPIRANAHYEHILTGNDDIAINTKNVVNLLSKK